MNSWEERISLVVAACCAEYELYAEGQKPAEATLKTIRELLALIAGPPMTPEQRERCQQDPEGVGAEMAERVRGERG